MNISKSEKTKRRSLVKQYLLTSDSSLTASEIGKRLKKEHDIKACRDTVEGDINWIEAYYTKLALNNPHIAELQHKKICKLQDEIELVKTKYWQILKELEDDKTPKSKMGVKYIEEALQFLSEQKYDKVKEKLHKALNYIETDYKPRFSTKLDTLKAIVNRTATDVQLLNLFNSHKALNSNNISIEVFQEVMKVIRSIIMDFIDADKKKYAIERIQAIDIELTKE